MPTAMGRSKRPPSLGKSAGDKLTVMRPVGKSKPVVSSAERTRSLLSRTTASGRPTMANVGSPDPKWTSTRTRGAASPKGARLKAVLTSSGVPTCIAAITSLLRPEVFAACCARLLRREPALDLLQTRFHGGQLGLGSFQNGGLYIELLPADQIEFAQLGLQHGLEIALQIAAEGSH